jgi:inorganic pyrophosphatase
MTAASVCRDEHALGVRASRDSAAASSAISRGGNAVEVTCFVEIPKGSRNKYEYDEERRVVRLDRHLFSSVVYPADYGFLEGMLSDTEGRLDALVLVGEPTFPGCRIAVRPVGLFRMRDEQGIDDKVLCVPVGDPEWAAVDDVEDVSLRLQEEIAHFFAVYTELEPNRVTAIEGWAGRAEAERDIEQARGRFLQREARRIRMRHGDVGLRSA